MEDYEKVQIIKNKEVLWEQIEYMNEEFYIKNLNYKRGIFYVVTKRFIDILGSLIGIIIGMPLFLIVSLCIKVDSKGPIFFSQKRVGKDGREFNIYKFRSMIVDAEDIKEIFLDKNEMSGPMFKIKDDPRITSIGRFIRRTSIDELPQLFNVLKGDMSLVGPRPNLPKEVMCFTEFQKLKLKVKPGLTCYWQVMGRNSIDFEDWMRLDVKYIEDRNIFLDIKLIFKTFRVFLGDKNAN